MSKIEKMVISVKMDRPINPDVHYISPGGYELMFVNGESIAFDFSESYGKIDKADPSVIHFSLFDLDTASFPESKILGKKLLLFKVTKIVECYIYTGEDNEDAPINPLEIKEMYFEISHNAPTTTVEIDNEILSAFPIKEVCC